MYLNNIFAFLSQNVTEITRLTDSSENTLMPINVSHVAEVKVLIKTPPSLVAEI